MLNSQAAGLRGRDGIMTSSENYRANREAISDVAARSGGVSPHDRAVERYLIAAQIRAGHPIATTTGPTGPTGRAATVPEDAKAGDPPSASTEPAPRLPDQRFPRDAIVVGLDRSAGADAAAGWAADEAARRLAPLLLVHAYHLPTVGAYPGYDFVPTDYLDQLRAAGARLLADTADHLRVVHPSMTVMTSLHHGSAVVALREASEHAQLTVVGNAPPSRFTGVLLGSVALAVTSSNPVPVAVIPSGSAPARGPIVVGVDGSPLSEAAVGFAFDEAALRGVDLIAVHAWNDVYLDNQGLQPLLVDPRTLEDQERALLGERLAGWAEKYPDVVVHRELRHQRPTTALLEHSRTAQLVVVGSRGRGGFSGMLLGSTSHALASHAHCPVIVIRRPSA
jgi:nucleotide-binding universal stress UspA family protein